MKVILTGKAIDLDIKKIAPYLGLSQAETDDLAIVETSRVFGFVYALAKGGKFIETWLREGNSGYFEGVGLKDYLELVNETRLIDKCPSNNNHRANFSDKDGRPVPWDRICYATGDAIFLTRRHITFEEKTGIPISSFATPLSHPTIGDNLSFVEALQELAGMDKNPNCVKGDLSSKTGDLYKALTAARPWAKTQMEIREKTMLHDRAHKSIFKRKHKIERLPGKKIRGVKVRFLRYLPKRVFTSTPVEVYEPSSFNEYHLSDDEVGSRNARHGPDMDCEGDDSGEFRQASRIVISSAEFPPPAPGEGVIRSSSLPSPHEGKGSMSSSWLPAPLEGEGSKKLLSLPAPLEGEGRLRLSFLPAPMGEGRVVVPSSPDVRASSASDSWESPSDNAQSEVSSGETSDNSMTLGRSKGKDIMEVRDNDRNIVNNNFVRNNGSKNNSIVSKFMTDCNDSNNNAKDLTTMTITLVMSLATTGTLLIAMFAKVRMELRRTRKMA